MKVMIQFRPLLLSLPVIALAAVLGLPVSPADAQRSERDNPGASEGRPPQREPLPPPRREREKAEREKKAAEPPKPIPSRMGRPGSGGVPETGAERAKLLAELYAYLATAADEQVGNRVAAAVELVWRQAGTDTVHLLMERAQRATTEKKLETAVGLLTRAARLAPDYPEVFRLRAAVHYARDDVYAAIGDLRRTIALEPNHFKALDMMGSIFKELGRKKAAYEMYRKLYEVHPQMSGAKSAYEELEREVVGQPG